MQVKTLQMVKKRKGLNWICELDQLTMDLVPITRGM